VTTMATDARVTSGARIDPRTTVGTVRLTVSDVDRSRAFYERVLGLRAGEFGDGGVALHAGGATLVELYGDASAPRRERRTTGLYHFALLTPSRVALADALARLVQARWPLDGASDHLVSEALYLSDPDGNGIEIYRDRPREQWTYRAGALQMATLPLDLQGILGELTGAERPTAGAAAEIRMGHVHLQISDLRDAEDFYSRVLGFDVVVRTYPGALFVSAGGYHHHLGLNTWHSAGAPAPPAGSFGLRSYDIVLPARAELERVLDRVRAAGIGVQELATGAQIRDPSGNAIRLRAAG
jgi:catechol 2,3-dioxygenase